MIFTNITRVLRLLRAQNRSAFVWKELIMLHKKANWHFGQYDNEKHIETSFECFGGELHRFNYLIADEKLIFKTLILNAFDPSQTRDIMVLSSHFNSIINYGVIRVDTKNNIIEYVSSDDLLVYLLYPDKINNDIIRHYTITKDCLWAFRKMLSSGDDPVFIIAELMKRINQEVQKNRV